MDFIESCQFHKYKDKKVIIEFSIEAVEYTRFKNTFTTDKYIDLCDWEYIFGRINDMIRQTLHKKTNCRKESFKIHDLSVTCEVADKADGRIDYKKFDYDLDWIIRVRITKTLSKHKDLKSRSKTDTALKRSSSDKLENDENVVIINDSQDSPNSKKAKIDVQVKRSPKILFKPTHNNDAKSKQNSWLSTTRSTKTASGNVPEKKMKQTRLVTTKEPKPTTSKDLEPTTSSSLEEVKEHIERLDEFVNRNNQQEYEQEQRKKELEDLQILNCYDMTKEEIIDIIKELKPKTDEIFQKSRFDLLQGKKINSIDFTTANILKDDQCFLITKTVANLRKIDNKETDDFDLHDFVLPFIIVEIFKRKCGIPSTSQAVKRIHLQNEKKLLNNEYFDESY